MLDWIALATMFITAFTAIASIVIAVNTSKENAKTNFENSRAHILFYIDYIRSSDRFFLTIKNFGNSIGKLNYIKITPNLDYKKIKGYYAEHSLLTDSKNIMLAPNQKVSSWFSFRNYPDKKFDIELQYETLGKTFTETYIIDLSFMETIESLHHSAIDCPNDKQALIWIEHQLSEISERLN